jgi:YtkA-like protein
MMIHRYAAIFFAVTAACAAAGTFDVKLRLPPDGLYAREEMEIEMRVEDPSRMDPVQGPAPVIRARIECTIEMPAMPGMPKYNETAHVEGIPGEYGIHPTFAHGGTYVLHVKVAPPEGDPFQRDFNLAVQDAEAARKHKPKPPRFYLELSAAPKTPQAGRPAELQLVIRDRENPGEVFNNFEQMHEKLLHLIIVRSDLTGFAHEHPEKAADGTFRLQYTFLAGGEYHLFAEAAPRGAGSQLMMAKLRVSGGKAASVPSPSGAAIEVRLPDTAVPARRMVTLCFELREPSTHAPIADLEPYLGAQGHLILIHQDATTFVHSHPDEIGQPGNIPFLARLPKPGRYRGWLQVKRKGVVVTNEFQLEAGAGE